MAIPRVAPAAPSLPDPTGSLLEVSFRRLLESCLEHLHGFDASAAAGGPGSGCGSGSKAGTTSTAAPTEAPGNKLDNEVTATNNTSAAGAASTAGYDSDTAARVLKMRHYVDTLRELLADLRAQQDALGLDATTLDLYDTTVKAVAAAVPKVQLPPYCQNLVTGSAAAYGVSSITSTSSSAVHPAPNMSYFTPLPPRPGLTPPAAANGGRGGPLARGTDVTCLSSAASERLREAEAAQALLTDELADLTAALKSNALGMAGAVSERGRLLDTTDAALTDSLVATKRNTVEAARQVKRSGGNLCFTCMMLLVVGLAFTSMVVYIKFTHLLGYRASGPAAPHSGGGKAWPGGYRGDGRGGGAYSTEDDALLGKRSGESYGGSAEPWEWRGEL